MTPADIVQVSPEGGLLAAGETAGITVRFTPQEVEDCSRRLIATIPNLAATVQPPSRAMTASVLRPWCHFDLPPSDYITAGQPTHQAPTTSPLSADKAAVLLDHLSADIVGLSMLAENAVALVDCSLSGTQLRGKCIWQSFRFLLCAGRRSPDMTSPRQNQGPLDPATKVLEMESLGVKVSCFYLCQPVQHAVSALLGRHDMQGAQQQVIPTMICRC